MPKSKPKFEAAIIKLNNVRLSFPNLFKPQTHDQDGKELVVPKYGASFLIDPNTPEGKKAKKQIIAQLVEAKKALDEQHGEKTRLKGTCLKAQDDELIEEHKLITPHEGKRQESYDSMFICTASNTKRPVVLNRDKSALTEEDDVIYAGCYVDASITLWIQDNNYGKRLNANLRAVRFRKDGEAFGGGAPVDVDAEFDDIDDDEDIWGDDD